MAITYLNSSLSPEKLILPKGIKWAQKHVDHDMIQIGLASLAPLQHNKKRKIAKQGIEK
jgi:hypothetical protein